MGNITGDGEHVSEEEHDKRERTNTRENMIIEREHMWETYEREYDIEHLKGERESMRAIMRENLKENMQSETEDETEHEREHDAMRENMREYLT